MRLTSRLTAFFLTLALLLSTIPLTTTALTEGDYKYTVSADGQSVTITAYTGSDAAVTVPSMIAGLPVTVIGKAAFESNRSITAVVLPETLEVIEQNAFNACIYLKDVTFPDSLRSIRELAFYNCLSLQSIDLGPYTYDIGYQAFHQTYWFNTFSSGPAYIGRVLYSYCGAMEDGATVTVKDGTAAIAAYAFAGQETLRAVYLPVGLRVIGSCAFVNCTSLTDIRMPPSVTTIGADIFLSAEAVIVHGVTDSTAHTYAEDSAVHFEYDPTLDYPDGDLNQDKLLNSTDIRLGLRKLVGADVSCDHERWLSCDFVYNGTIDSSDVQALFRFILGL